ncbi:MAG TPA: type II secretion system F family protein [Acidimicrobiia bacterium]|jgi:tight adherence protein C
MSGLVGLPLLAALLAGVAASLLAGALVRPRTRLAGRLRPYIVVSRSLLGRTVEVGAMPRRGGDSALARIFAPPLIAVSERFGRLVDASGEEALRGKLRQSGLLRDVPDPNRVQQYRVRQFLTATAGAAAGFTIGYLVRPTPLVVLVASAAGLAAGASYWRGKVDRAIEERRTRMRIELYTVNQLLAMRIRVGGGVVSAVRNLVERGQGVVVEELGEALRLHQGGMAAGAAFRRVADLTAEPHARRCYQVLATADERGSDLAAALLALSEDIRDDRREAIRRQATRRRGAMLIPILLFLAPILILFVAAPLPWIVLRGFG